MKEALQNFEIKVSDNGHDRCAAATFHHDDLICALGIATFLASQRGSRTIQIW